MFKKIRIRSYEVGLKFRNGDFVGLLGSGKHFVFTRFGKTEVRVVSKRDPWLVDEQLDVIVKSGALDAKAEVIDLQDHQRALVWIDGRFSRVLGPGLYAYWIGVRDVRLEVVAIENARFEHQELASIIRGGDATRWLDVCKIDRDQVGVLFLDGRYVDELSPGLYAFWKEAADARVVELDMRESQVDVSGQEIFTADKVTLRINAIITYVVKDARRAVSASTDVRQSLYRETQLALRSAVGGRELDGFLGAKDRSEASWNLDEFAVLILFGESERVTQVRIVEDEHVRQSLDRQSEVCLSARKPSLQLLVGNIVAALAGAHRNSLDRRRDIANVNEDHHDCVAADGVLNQLFNFLTDRV